MLLHASQWVVCNTFSSVSWYVQRCKCTYTNGGFMIETKYSADALVYFPNSTDCFSFHVSLNSAWITTVCERSLVLWPYCLNCTVWSTEKNTNKFFWWLSGSLITFSSLILDKRYFGCFWILLSWFLYFWWSACVDLSIKISALLIGTQFTRTCFPSPSQNFFCTLVIIAQGVDVFHIKLTKFCERYSKYRFRYHYPVVAVWTDENRNFSNLVFMGYGNRHLMKDILKMENFLFVRQRSSRHITYPPFILIWERLKMEWLINRSVWIGMSFASSFVVRIIAGVPSGVAWYLTNVDQNTSVFPTRSCSGIFLLFI